MRKSIQKTTVVIACVLIFVSSAQAAHLPISEEGIWTGSLPDKITVKETARVKRSWYAKGVIPFILTLTAGSRTGLEWNEGRNIRPSEVLRGIPGVGLLALPYYCYESLSGVKMQEVANKTKIDDPRQLKYNAIIKRLTLDGRIKEAEHLEAHNPFEQMNHPPNPLASMPEENLHGFKGKMKTGFVELVIGHRVALERNESRGVRKLEKWHPLIFTKIIEAFQAGFGKKMEDIAEDEHLDEVWL